ncbi:MAG: bifunctional aspartate kinase/homoserine dehydrogenase I [Gammaproteobacteria bacterium]|nr:bifunctional aspartate kinase/homoserine dehydrogenase I [Gammaproteobacteria bacterium]
MKNKNVDVFKFGGSSLADSDCLLHVCDLIHQNSTENLIVVVSAMSGVTNQLLAISKDKNDENCNAISNHFKKTIEEISIDSNNKKELLSAFSKDIETIEKIIDAGQFEANKTEENPVLGFGEIWSSNIIFNLLLCMSSKDPQEREVHFLNPLDIINLSYGEMGPMVNWEKSLDAFNEKTQDKSGIFIMGGFLASDDSQQPTNLGRNGSDYSASIMGSLAEAKSVSIWTDVDGIMTGDPNQIQRAKIIKQMSYDEAMELAYFGAKVIHPKTMAPLMNKGIPIYIKNTFNPDSIGTKILLENNDDKSVKGMTTIDDLSLINLEGAGMIGVPGTAKRLFSCLSDAGISVVLITQASSEHSICFAINDKDSKRIESVVREEFLVDFQNGNLQKLQIQNHCSIIAVVGSGMSGTKGIAAKFFRAMLDSRTNVMAIAQGSSEKNISAVVKTNDVSNAIHSMHQAFFDQSIDVNIGIVGYGNVGKEFLKQLQNQRKYLELDSDIRLNIIAVSNSTNMVLKNNHIEANDLENLDTEQETNILNLIKHISQSNGAIKVLIDCTTSEDIPNIYKNAFVSDIHVIAANKKGVSGPIDLYQDIMHFSKSTKKSFHYETTAGAGLPFIKTLQDLNMTGDKVNEIEGVFSGTLSYLFNNYNGKLEFSKMVADARDKGFTEPDPRDDLSGMDVARKLVILAREMNLTIDISDVSVESLVPEELRDISVNDYLNQLSEYDEAMNLKLTKARQDQKVLRYVARLNSSGKASVKLESVSTDHPFAELKGSENIIKYMTERYSNYPLVHKGPGAGTEVTAAGIFSDLLMVIQHIDRFNPLIKK